MTTPSPIFAKAAASVLALSLAAGAALAQPPPGAYPPPPPPGQGYAPPPGEYAPPPGPDTETMYDARARAYDREYAQRYDAWSARYCVEQRKDNTAKGAVIGGVLGALLGSNVAANHHRTDGTIAGAAVGALAGAAIGANSHDNRACPPGYMERAGAPAFYYPPPPAYRVTVVEAPPWYNPWVYEYGRWTYHPYRDWYWSHREHWRPEYRDRYDHDHDRRDRDRDRY